MIFILLCLNTSFANNYTDTFHHQESVSTTIWIPKYETQWIKSYIVKKSLKAIASALRSFSDDTLRKLAEVATSDVKTINKIIKDKHSLANQIDNIADKYDYVTTSIRDGIYYALLPYRGHDIAWVLSRLLDLALL